MLAVRDIYHREWNDIINGLKSCDLWWVVVGSTLLLNLGHGPWANARWYQQWLEGAQDLMEHEEAG
eukprot:1261157-Lingulodinium_polyedra.AAC.1